MEIPVLFMVRTAGTHEQEVSRERKNRCKHLKWMTGKTVIRSGDATRTEIKVGKDREFMPGKAAMAP